MALELYHNNMSVCAQKVRLVLAEKGVEGVTKHHLNLRKGDQFEPAYLAMNPNGVVPTLVVDGRPIIESTLICEYLDEAHPEPAMRPADLVARADMRRWAVIPDTGLHAACGTVSFAIAFRHQLLALSPEEIERNINDSPDPARRERKRQTVEKGLDAPIFADAVRAHDKIFARMEARLGEGGPYLLGAEYTLADAGLTPYVFRASQLQLSPLFDGRPNLKAWLARIEARPNFSGIRDYLDPKYIELMTEQGQAAQAKVSEILA